MWANLHYYWAMAKDSWHARRWRDKLRVWFAPPGWRPADVAARFPKPDYDPRRDFSRSIRRAASPLSVYALVQIAVLIAANSHFLALLPKQPAWSERAVLSFHPGGSGDPWRRPREPPRIRAAGSRARRNSWESRCFRWAPGSAAPATRASYCRSSLSPWLRWS